MEVRKIYKAHWVVFRWQMSRMNVELIFTPKICRGTDVMVCAGSKLLNINNVLLKPA